MDLGGSKASAEPMTEELVPPSRWYPSVWLSWYARLIVRLRWVVVAFWLAAVGTSMAFLPAIGHGGNDLNQLLSADNPALQSELRSFEKFGFPLLSRVAVVQRDPEGLSMATQAEALMRARALSEGDYPDLEPLVAAVPVMNTVGLVPGSRESQTTIITLLFTPPDVPLAEQVEAAQRFVDGQFDADDAVVGVTGSVPARVEQGRIVLSSLPWLELATVAAVFLIVWRSFRSLIAPVIALAVAGVAVLLTLHIGGAVAGQLEVPIPQETQPLLVALLLGVVTDYVVFYLSAVRGELASGIDKLNAAERAAARFTPIIATAGATAAAGTGALIVAESPAFRAFGPGMAMAVFIGMLVSVTLVPALLAILGSAALWSPRLRPETKTAEAEAAQPSGRWARLLTRPVVSAVVMLACVGGLAAATIPLRHFTLGVSFVDALPPGHSARQAASEAETGFAAGILAPTELLIQGQDVASREAELTRLQELLAEAPGVAAVLGPGDNAIPEELNVFRAPDGSAARYMLVLADEPLGARAIDTVSTLRDNLPGLAEAAGLAGVEMSLGGDTAVAEAVVDQTVQDLGRIAIAALIANLLFLLLFLRSLAVSVGLLACSVLAIGATLGLTSWMFLERLGGDGLTFYVPFAAAVLLVALGSDDNIFGIGQAWKEARGRPLREALAITLPQSARAIRIAAVTLAVSFGLLVLVPLRPFRELAFALSVGILIDAFVVRSLLAPALLTIMESVSRRRGRQLVEPEPSSEPGTDELAKPTTGPAAAG
jgi:putative drug exporter of the RND superfamily